MNRCKGHPAGTNAVMGVSSYCDGSCVRNSNVVVSTVSFGARPHGIGGWMFCREKSIDFGSHRNDVDFIQVSGAYAEAKKKAVEWARGKGYKVIYLQP